MTDRKGRPLDRDASPRSRAARGARSFIGWGIALVAVAAGWSADQTAGGEDDDIVSLPPLMVESREAPLRWRYVASPGLEVISVCDDLVTKKFVERALGLDQVLTLLVPKRFQVRMSVPNTHILFGDDLRRVRSQEIMKEMLGRSGSSSAQVGGGSLPLASGLRPGGVAGTPWARRRVSFLPNMRLADVDAYVVFAATGTSDLDQLNFTLDGDRIAFLLEHRVPALPDWYLEGVAGLYARARLTTEGIDFAPALWISEEETRALRLDGDRPRTLLPVEELLTGVRPKQGEDAGERGRVWRAECALFVRWAMLEQQGKRKEGLWALLDRLDDAPLTESLFRECLGLGFADMRDLLSDYLPEAIAQGGSLRAGKLPDLPVIKVRAATDVEVARIRGDWERLEVVHVSRRWPELTDKYLEQVRRTLQGAYRQGVRDPGLLAVVGLTECDAGNPSGARAYLEAAVLGGVERPRVYAELARLRLEEFQAANGDEAFSALQVTKVLEPLRAALRLDPPLPMVYAVMADVWTRSAEAPAPADLAVLHRGARLFPRFSAYLLRVIYLEAKNGQIEPARELVELGLRFAADPTMRGRFERIQEELNQARSK